MSLAKGGNFFGIKIPPPFKAARPGLRVAYVCSAKGCIPPHRVFLEPGAARPTCPEHNRMERQENRQYGDQSTS